MMTRHPMSKLHHVHFVFASKLMNVCHVFWLFLLGLGLVVDFSGHGWRSVGAKNKEKSKNQKRILKSLPPPTTRISSMTKHQNESIICKPGHDDDNDDVDLE